MNNFSSDDNTRQKRVWATPVVECIDFQKTTGGQIDFFEDQTGTPGFAS